MSGPARVTKAEASEISRVMGAIGEVFADEDPNVVFMALLGMSIYIQYPEITIEQLQKGVFGASEWIALYVTEAKNGTDVVTDPKQVH